MAEGSISIVNSNKKERARLEEHIANGSILMSGRHLQHGDSSQKDRVIELFSNCSTANSSFLLFYLLVNGSGVGRDYTDNLMVIDWSKQPFIHVVLNETHPDYDHTSMESLQQVQHKYGKYVTTYTVQDSREGWAKALEYLEALIFEGTHEDNVIVFDFSKVRAKGELIGGMQLRPSSGPVATMNMFNKIKSLKGCKNPLWLQNMYVDHYAAESVLVGGARRASRIAVKHWRDPEILDFIHLKKSWTIPDSFNKAGELIRKGRKTVPLWSANNSVGIDEEFWAEHKIEGAWAKTVFDAICDAAYDHGTGEPGMVNLHKLETNKKDMFVTNTLGSSRYNLEHGTLLMNHLSRITSTKKHVMITNPCGEIALSINGGYCVIADVVPYHCDNMDEAEEAVRLATRALIRTNLLSSVYQHETNRTNRIGVALTGVHEWMWKFFKVSFRDVVNNNGDKVAEFYHALMRLSKAARDESIKYSKELGVNVPHTSTTMKPSGTISKLFDLTEGAHLPNRREYIRWVQHRYDDPLVKVHEANGYRTIRLKQYEGTTIVGFPTTPSICGLGVGDKLITAPEATMSEQFEWVKLLEKYWLCGGVEGNYGNQVSYTLKFDRSKVSKEKYKSILSRQMPQVRCCSVMPTNDNESEHEYLPEQPVSKEEFQKYLTEIKCFDTETIDEGTLTCSTGACPL